MRREQLRLPLRLARAALDQARVELVAAVDRRQALETELAHSREARVREGFEEARELQVLASFVERSRRRERDLTQLVAAAEAEEAARLAGLRARRIEVRRLELLDARLAGEERLAAARREQRELDAFVNLRTTDRR